MNRYFTHESILGGKVILKLDHYDYGQAYWLGDLLISLAIIPSMTISWFTKLLNERRRKSRKRRLKRKKQIKIIT